MHSFLSVTERQGQSESSATLVVLAPSRPDGLLASFPLVFIGNEEEATAVGRVDAEAALGRHGAFGSTFGASVFGSAIGSRGHGLPTPFGTGLPGRRGSRPREQPGKLAG